MPDLKLLTITEGRLQGRPDFDMTFDGAGRFQDGPTFLTGRDVAVQDTVRGLLTLRGTNALVPDYGTIISQLIGSRTVDDLSGPLTEEIQFLLGYLAQVAADSPIEEQIVELVNLSIKQNEGTVEVPMTVQTGSGELATVVVA